MNERGIIKKVQDTLSRNYITDPSLYSVEDIILLEGGLVKSGKINGSQARIVVKSEKAIITIDESITSLSKKRFVLAHELGHFLMHKHDIKSFHTDSLESFIQWQGARKEEVEANIFAANLLMPEYIFTQECEGEDFSIELIKHLMDRFKSGLLSTSIRYTVLGKFPVVVIFSVDGIVKWASINPEFPTMETPLSWIPYGIPVPPDSMANDLFKGQNISGEEYEVDISYYFHEDKCFEYYEDWSFMETALFLEEYNSVITFIYPI